MQVLMSVMNSKDPIEYIKKANITSNYILVNQITKNNINLTNTKINNNKKIISLFDKGLSKSRNIAIDNATDDIVLLSDDDVKYVSSYEKIIEKAYEKYPEADIIAFVVEHENKKNEKNVLKEGKIGLIKSMKISSVQISFRLNSIKENNIKFDKNFGAGSDFFCGEENIFLFDCIKAGLKIYYVPIKIGIIKYSESTWFNGFNEQLFKTQGAVFYRLSKFIFPIFIFQYAIRKRKYYLEKYKIKDVVKFMFNGKKIYKRIGDLDERNS